MEPAVLARKRIWEVDCWSLDAAVASSFDWRDLINLMQGQGFDLKKPDSLLELQAQHRVHEYSHSENPVSIKLETLLNDWHRKTLNLFDRQSPAEIAEYVLTQPFRSGGRYAGTFWALGTDARDGFDCIRRRFFQRFQIHSVRKLVRRDLERTVFNSQPPARIEIGGEVL